MKVVTWLFAVAATVFGVVSGAMAATNEDVQRLVQAMITKEDSRKLLSWQEYETATGETQVVFVQNGKRYTVFYSGYSWSGRDSAVMPAKEQWITIWVRPNGTSSPEAGDSFTDFGLDGNVDDGILGLYPITPVTGDIRKNYRNGANRVLLEGEKFEPVGVQYQSYWQKRYDAAIRGILHFYGR